MKSSIKIIIAAVVTVALLAGGIVLYKQLSGKVAIDYTPTENNSASSDPESAFEAAKDFTVYDGDGNAVSLSSFKGKSVVVNFWADWCPPCISELPDFQKAYENYKDVVFMMVNIDSTPQLISSFVQRNGYNFPIYYDTDHSANNAYGLSTFPKSIFVDPDGNLVKLQVGMMDEASLNEAIELIRR